MFEIPEYVTLARQMAESLSGKRIATGTLGNSPHKFVWYNRKPAEVASLVKGKTVGRAHSRGRWRTWEAPASTARHARKHRETHLPNVVEDRWPAERHMRST
jgi:formamidopyrimidine-DNA glycosylase